MKCVSAGRHKALRLLIIMLVLAFVGAVASGKEVTLVFWENSTPEWIDAAEQAVAEFERQNPGIKVDLQARPDKLEQVLPVRVAGGAAPDVVSFFGSAFKSMAMQGLFLDIEPYVRKEMLQSELADFFPGQMEFFRLNGTRFALPQYAGAVVTLLNGTLFSEAGLGLPQPGWSVEEFLQIARKLTVDRTGDGQFDQWGFAVLPWYDRVAPWIRRFGGSILKDGNPRLLGLDQPESIEALEFLQGLRFTYRVSPMSTSAQYRLQSERVAMEENGPWQVTQYSGKLKEATFDLGVVEPVRGAAGRATMVSSDGYSVVACTKHPEESFRLVRFLAGQYASKLRASIAGLQPSRRSVARTWLEAMPRRFEAAQGVNWEVFLRAVEYAQPDPVFYRHSDVMQILDPALSSILNKGAPVKTTVAQVADPIRAILGN